MLSSHSRRSSPVPVLLLVGMQTLEHLTQVAWKGPGNLRDGTFPLSGSSSRHSLLCKRTRDNILKALWESQAAGWLPLKLQMCEAMFKPELASQGSKMHAEKQVSPRCNASQTGTRAAEGISA